MNVKKIYLPQKFCCGTIFRRSCAKLTHQHEKKALNPHITQIIFKTLWQKITIKKEYLYFWALVWNVLVSLSDGVRVHRSLNWVRNWLSDSFSSFNCLSHSSRSSRFRVSNSGNSVIILSNAWKTSTS